MLDNAQVIECLGNNHQNIRPIDIDLLSYRIAR